VLDDEVVDCGGGVHDLETAVHEAEGSDCGIGAGGLGDVGGAVLACEGAVFGDPVLRSVGVMK